MNLPAAMRRLMARKPPSAPADALPAIRRSSIALRLLIVDDEEDVRAALSALLRAVGHHTRVAKSGAEALDLILDEPFDIMLCDIRMAEMSGLDLVPQALHLDANLAVLMLTGIIEIETASEALARGAMDYLVKPIELSDLEEAIHRAAQRRQFDMDNRAIEDVSEVRGARRLVSR